MRGSRATQYRFGLLLLLQKTRGLELANEDCTLDVLDLYHVLPLMRLEICTSWLACTTSDEVIYKRIVTCSNVSNVFEM